MSEHRLSPAAVRQIDRTCDRFEVAWKSGPRPDPCEYLSGTDGPERAELLRHANKPATNKMVVEPASRTAPCSNQNDQFIHMDGTAAFMAASFERR